MQLSEFLEQHGFLKEVTEQQIELILATDYNTFIKQLKVIYREYFNLLHQFIGVNTNFVEQPCKGTCTKYVLEKIRDLIKLNDLI